MVQTRAQIVHHKTLAKVVVVVNMDIPLHKVLSASLTAETAIQFQSFLTFNRANRASQPTSHTKSIMKEA